MDTHNSSLPRISQRTDIYSRFRQSPLDPSVLLWHSKTGRKIQILAPFIRVRVNHRPPRGFLERPGLVKTTPEEKVAVGILLIKRYAATDVKEK